MFEVVKHGQGRYRWLCYECDPVTHGLWQDSWTLAYRQGKVHTISAHRPLSVGGDTLRL